MSEKEGAGGRGGGEGRGWSPIPTDRLVPLEAAESAPSVWWSVTRSSSLLPSNAKPGRELACPLPPSLSHSSLASSLSLLLPDPSPRSLFPLLLSLLLCTSLLSSSPPHPFILSPTPSSSFRRLRSCKKLKLSQQLERSLQRFIAETFSIRALKTLAAQTSPIHQHKSLHFPAGKGNPSRKCCSVSAALSANPTSQPYLD